MRAVSTHTDTHINTHTHLPTVHEHTHTCLHASGRHGTKSSDIHVNGGSSEVCGKCTCVCFLVAMPAASELGTGSPQSQLCSWHPWSPRGLPRRRCPDSCDFGLGPACPAQKDVRVGVRCPQRRPRQVPLLVRLCAAPSVGLPGASPEATGCLFSRATQGILEV